MLEATGRHPRAGWWSGLIAPQHTRGAVDQRVEPTLKADRIDRITCQQQCAQGLRSAYRRRVDHVAEAALTEPRVLLLRRHHDLQVLAAVGRLRIDIAALWHIGQSVGRRAK